MSKENIHIIQLLEEIPAGIAVFSVSDRTMLHLQHERISVPHRHDHYCCFFVEKGNLNFNIDFHNYDIGPSSMLVSCPGQVHQLGSADELEGWLLAFDPKFVDRDARMVIEQSFAKAALLQLDADEKSWFSDMCRLIGDSTNEKTAGTFQQQLSQTLIKAFFYRVVSVFQSQEENRVQEHSLRSIEIAKTFHRFVREHFTTLKKPAEYASKMNITVSYLNDTVKSVTGFPSTYFIQQEVFREAQRLLVYTDKSVKEIAVGLGYDDYTYFIRLFGKTTGTSPVVFRKNNR